MFTWKMTIKMERERERERESLARYSKQPGTVNSRQQQAGKCDVSHSSARSSTRWSLD